MSLSKKNLGKLKSFIKQNIFINNNNNSGKNPQVSNNSHKVDDPSKIFYSIIDNSDNINDTSNKNPLLKKSEEIFHNINSKKTINPNNLSTEDELYDEFNYLLDE